MNEINCPFFSANGSSITGKAVLPLSGFGRVREALDNLLSPRDGPSQAEMRWQSKARKATVGLCAC